MGGKAIMAAHGLETVRLEKQDYEKFLTWFQGQCPKRVYPVQAYFDKANFGDADFVHCCKTAPIRFVDWPYVTNGNVHSLGVPLDCLGRPGEYFQVDLIYVPEDTLDFALGYFGYNDLGNLIGRVAHRMGLKFGHDGLWVTLREDDHLIDNVLVTKDYTKALAFLGYKAYQGFACIEDIFRYVTTSQYFSKDLFPLEHRNTKARMRDRKRPTYNAFLQWLDQTKPPDGLLAIPRSDSVARANASFATLQRVSGLFPGFSERLVAVRQCYAATQLERNLFNGELVANTVPLVGKDLGMFISYFKDSVGHDLFSFWVLSTDQNHKECALRAAYIKYYYNEQKEIT